MRRCRRFELWLLLYLGCLGCSQIVDFDRAKVDHGGLGLGDSAVIPSEGGLPSRDGGSPGGGLGGIVDAGSVEAGTRCTSNQPCANDELCCEGECRKTSVAQCASCNTGCASNATSACKERSCVCGAGPACTAPAPYCLPSGSSSACAECNGAKDCEGRSDGKTQCVAGKCAACNPGDNAGCSGNTPICSAAGTCQRCTASPDNCPGSLVCTASGACGGCSNGATDCTSPTSPICDSASTQCRGCGAAAAGDGECKAQRQKPYCEAGRCGACRPGSDMGCDLASNKPDCRTDSAGQYECQGCASNVDCAHAPRSLCDTGTGSCAECTSDLNCSDPRKPLCDAGTCKGCGTVGGGGLANLWCLANTLTLRPVCDAGSGRCVICTANAGCGNNSECRVNSSAPEDNVCVGCIDHSDCSGNNDRCDPASNTCIDCDASGGCSGTNNQCLLGNRPGANMCVDCINDNGCSGGSARCNTATHTCIECTQSSQCIDEDACTTDTCDAGRCVHTMASTEDGFSCTDGKCNPDTGTITQDPVHTRCTADEDMCTVERCTAGAGTQPSGCASEPAITCEAGVCLPATGMCVE